jgi:ABC-2 type transport system ATP-binding protein
MRQKLLISSALVHRPEVVVVDEPMVGLDPKSARTLKDLLRAFVSRGGTVLMSTHTLEVAEAMCDRIAIIRASAWWPGTMELGSSTRRATRASGIPQAHRRRRRARSARCSMAEAAPRRAEHRHHPLPKWRSALALGRSEARRAAQAAARGGGRGFWSAVFTVVRCCAT